MKTTAKSVATLSLLVSLVGSPVVASVGPIRSLVTDSVGSPSPAATASVSTTPTTPLFAEGVRVYRLQQSSHGAAEIWSTGDSLRLAARGATRGQELSVRLHIVRISVGLQANQFCLGKHTQPEEQLRVRVDFRALADQAPGVVVGRTGPLSFVADVVALNMMLLSLQEASQLLGLAHAHPLPWEAGIPVISFGGIEDNSLDVAWKDSNFADPYFNVVGHPLAFFSMSSYFRRCRGYAEHWSFLGGIVMNFLWEAMWENIERPLSLHDLVMNTLGAACGSFDSLGLAFGFDLLRPGDFSSYYTEFYGKTSDSTRTFVRLYPTEEYPTMPLIPWVLGLGFSYESETFDLTATVDAIPSSQQDDWNPSPGFTVEVGLTF